MAKKQKKKATAKDILTKADNKHYVDTEKMVKQVSNLYLQAIDDLTKLAAKVDALPDKPFSFDQNPAMEAEVKKTIEKLSDRITTYVERGARKEWTAACVKSDNFIKSIMDVSKLTKGTLQSYQDRNLAALAAFTQREVDGMNLSRRVWKHVAPLKDEVELAVDCTKYYKHGINSGKTMTKMERAIGTGMSAQELSREVRSCLLEPNKLFRRVRDKYGNLQLSKAAKLYHPGQGVYRSSYKNAMRLTRSEINMAYRQSDHLRWQQLDFVVGMKIELSNNHTVKDPHGKGVLPLYDICDELAGNYPKDFKFVGWHPQCRCHATPILRPLDEIDNGVADSEGNWQSFPSSNEVKETPKNYDEYMRANAERIAGWKSTPYYIKDNPQFFDRALHPEKYKVVALVLDDVMQKKLTDFEVYGFNHQGSKLFNEALNRAKEAVLKGQQEAFDKAMAEMEARIKKNEGSVAYRAAKKKQAEIEAEAMVNKMIADDLATFTPEQTANIKELEKLLKQRKGLRMSYEEANTGRENPNYSNGGQYRVNCQTCTVTHELRRRGFNVEAKGKTEGFNTLRVNGYGFDWQRRFLNPDGSKPRPNWSDKWGSAKGYKVMNQKRLEEFFNDTIKEAGRYEVYCGWKGGSAHVFCVEKTKDGKITWFDPQPGKKGQSVESYVAMMKPGSVYTMRIDDKIINPKMADAFKTLGEIPIVPAVKVKTREEIIAEIAEKRHAARTDEQKQKLQEFWTNRKAETKALRNELNSTITSAQGIEDAKSSLKSMNDLLVGNSGAITTKAGKTATASMEKLRKAAQDIRKVTDEYNAAMADAKAIAGEFSGIVGVDTDTILKQKSISGILAEKKKLEKIKEDIIGEAIRWKNEFDGIKDLDTKMISDTIKNGKLSSIRDLTDKIKEIKKAEEAMADLIPNAHELHKTYTLAELQEAHKELDGVFSKWLNKYGYSSIDNAPIDHLKNKLDFELSSPTFRYSNKTIIDKAITEKIAIINRKIEWDNNVAKLSALKSFNTKSAKYKDLLAKVEEAINSKDLDALKKSIAEAEAEQSNILAKRVNRGGDVKTALNAEYKGGAVGTDISASIDVRTMTSEDPYGGTFTNNIARMQGFDAPAKLVSAAEFDTLEKNCGEVFYRTVNPTTFKGKKMTSQEFASQLYVADKLELNGPGGRVYGDGMYVAVSAWDGRTLKNLTSSLKAHAYSASICYGNGNHTISEMTFTRKPRIIKQTDLNAIWRNLSDSVKAKFGYEANTYACALGYDAMYTTRDYMVIWNRSIIAVKKQ